MNGRVVVFTYIGVFVVRCSDVFFWNRVVNTEHFVVIARRVGFSWLGSVCVVLIRKRYGYC